MQTINLTAGQTTDFILAPGGARVSLSGSGYIKFAPGTIQDAKEGRLTFKDWPLASTAGFCDLARPVVLYAVGTGDCTVTIDQVGGMANDDEVYWVGSDPEGDTSETAIPVTASVNELTGRVRNSTGQVVSVLGQRAPIPAIGGPQIALSDVTVLAGSPTVTLEAGPNGMPAIKIVTGVGVNCEIAIPSLTGSYCDGEAFLSMHGSYSQTNLDYITWYVSQDDASYAKGWSTQVQYALAAPMNSSREQGGAITYHFRKAARINFGTPTFPAYVGASKLRIVPRSGLSATIYIYSFAQATLRQKGRICVVWDDGYDSMFKLGYDSFASRGIKQTVAVIASAQGAGGGYSNANQLRTFTDAGNACVAHGPFPNSGAGNLFTAYTGSSNPVADAVADMQRNRDYLRDNGLLLTGADQCYVWPQGAFQQAVNDVTLLDAARAAGFSLARSVSEVAAGVNTDALSKYNRMAVPIIGHTWAGTTAAEATNITNITNRIAALSTDRTDGFLMLHRVQPTTTADGSMSSIGIRKGDLETIAAAIKSGIDAGTLESVTMPELAIASGGFWGEI